MDQVNSLLSSSLTTIYRLITYIISFILKSSCSLESYYGADPAEVAPNEEPLHRGVSDILLST